MTLDGWYATFDFDEREKDFVMDCALFVDQNAKFVYDFFGIESNRREKPTIHIIPTKDEFDRIYKKICNKEASYNVPSWVIGFASGDIYYLSINDYKNTSHAFSPDKKKEAVCYYKKTLVHEFVHFVHEQFNKEHGCCNRSKWLSEGVAVYLSGQHGVLNNDNDFNYAKEEAFGQQGNHYMAYGLLFRYLTENYPKAFVFSLFESAQNASESFKEELYGKAKKYYNSVAKEKK